LINFVDATNDANHYTKPPPMITWQRYLLNLLMQIKTCQTGPKVVSFAGHSKR